MTYVENKRKELKTSWPIETGLTGGTQKQTGRVMNLIPVGILGVKSTVSKNECIGI